MSIAELRNRALEQWSKVEESSKPVIRIGRVTCGDAAGAGETQEALDSLLKKHKIKASVMQVGCIGLCYVEPLVDIAKPNMPRVMYHEVNPKKMEKIVESYLLGDDPSPDLALGTIGEKTIDGIPRLFDLPMLKPQVRIALKNCGHIDPENFDHYLANDGMVGFEKALSMKPEEVIEVVLDSGLRGRGGAGFPTGRKWGFARSPKSEVKYLICNADEGDPGAFMDRSLLEGDPFAVLEGMLIGAYAIGATEGYIYARAEYPLAIKRLKTGIKALEDNGLLGDDIMGSGFDFHIKIKEGAGAFVCGEETALIASIEGRRGMPRTRPPFPAISGLWGKPTNINNVETLGNVPAILRNGADWFAQFGTEKSKGTKTFALAGKVKRTGLIEVPLGITLNDIVFKVGGGILGDREFAAAQTGGPSGGCIPAELGDTPVDYENLARVGSIMGSGGMVVLDERTCMVDLARYFLAFTQNESCGKCVPCRLGTKQMLRILEDICAGNGKEGDIQLLEEIGTTVKVASLCGLGQTAPNPVVTTVKYFRDQYEAHIYDHKCPAGVCKNLVTYFIDAKKCTGCGACLKRCPTDAITGEKKKPHVIDVELCIRCGLCYDRCKFDAIIVK